MPLRKTKRRPGPIKRSIVPRPELRTDNGAPLFPNHLHNVKQIIARANRLLDAREATRFHHPEFSLRRSYNGGISVSFIYDEGHELVLEERFANGRLQTTFVHKEHLIECLDLLKRELVLDDLSDI